MARADRVDLLVVGGGPAGLATAIRGRLAGLGTTLVERLSPPVDRACGEGLMPDGVAQLRALGVEPPAADSAVFRGIRYLDGELVAEGRFPGEPGLGIRRTALHGAMVRRAEALGVDLRWGTTVTALADAGVVTADGELGASWIVAADGRSSRLRRWAGLDGPPAPHRRVAVRRHFAVEPWTDLVEVYWSDGAEAYVTPVGPRRVGVALIWSGAPAGFDELLGRFPALERRLAGAAVDSRDRGAGPLEQRARAVTAGRLALVGDASGYLDPITGEGLSLAFHHARAVVEAVTSGGLEPYRAAHRRIGRPARLLTRLLLFVERRPRLRRRMVAALAGDPGLFSRFLAIHVRALPVRGLGLGGVLRLSRGLAGV